MSNQWIQYDPSQGSNVTDGSDTTYFIVINESAAKLALLKIDPTNGDLLPITEIAPGIQISNPPPTYITPGVRFSNPPNCTNVNGTIYFFAQKTGVANAELWKIDPTTHIPVQVTDDSRSDTIINPSNLTNINGTLYFTSYDNITDNDGLWKIDPNTGSLLRVMEPIADVQIYDASNLTNIDGTLYFAAHSNENNSTELWKIDSNTGNPLRLTNNISLSGLNSNTPLNLISVNGNFYFTATKGAEGYGLWKLDPTMSNSLKIFDTFPYNLTNVNGTLYFTSFYSGLWKIDSATTNPISVKGDMPGYFGWPNPYSVNNVNGTLYFNGDTNGIDVGLWKIDPTTGNPVEEWNFQPGGSRKWPVHVPSVVGYTDGKLYVSTFLNYLGTNLWILDDPNANNNAGVKLFGGNGDDRYNVNNLNDTIVENFNGGIDTVYANVSGYKLPDNVERLYLQGNIDVGFGNTLDNSLHGNQWNNLLYGRDGNDYIYGGAGKDVMIGGSGNDIYDVDNLNDVVVEYSDQEPYFEGGGVDEVYASVSGYTLGYAVERLRLYGNATSGTGNELDNALYGNNLNDTLDGKDGNDYIYGGVGNDTMIGGLGNDIYDVDNLNDYIVENADEGVDEVYASFSGYTLGANLERLRLYGNATSGTGNELDNALYGNLLNDTLDGKDGNDYIYGGAGNDTMIGGLGDDIYDVDNLNDVIVENAGEGIDEVYASFSGYTLGDHLEVLRLYNDAASGNGNALDNTLYGNHLDDTLNGGAGNDILIGGAGNDILTGGSGNDTFLFRADACPALSSAGIDTITDFTVGQDKIQLGQSIFSSLTTSVGTLSVDEFSIVMSDVDAETSSAAIVYNSINGKLFYNADLTMPGLGTNGGQFAQLATSLALTNSQFEAIG